MKTFPLLGWYNSQHIIQRLLHSHQKVIVFRFYNNYDCFHDSANFGNSNVIYIPATPKIPESTLNRFDFDLRCSMSSVLLMEVRMYGVCGSVGFCNSRLSFLSIILPTPSNRQPVRGKHVHVFKIVQSDKMMPKTLYTAKFS